MAEPNVLDRMRADWNERARVDANYYVAFGRRDQDDEEFFSTAHEVIPVLEAELRRFTGRAAALEIGCGPGRLLRPMSRHFADVHGVDVSDEMVRLARERLRGIPNAHAHATTGTDLAQFAGDTFDFAYSYAVFQHIPSREVVFRYLEEARRVLKPGGVLRCQINGLPKTAARYTTWDGVRISAAEVAEFAREHDFQLLALDGENTQYMWTTLRKMPADWARNLAWGGGAAVAGITNANTGEAAAPTAGPLSAVSIWMVDLPADCDLNHLSVTAEGRPCRLSYLGPPSGNVTQLNAALPEGLRTGLMPIEIGWLGRPLCPPGWIRLIPAGPRLPRLCLLTDAVNLLARDRTASGLFKVSVQDVSDAEAFRATLDGRDVLDMDRFCSDPHLARYEFNFRVPDGTAPGGHELRLSVGRRTVAVVPVEVG